MKHHFIIIPAAGKGTHVQSLTKKITESADAHKINYEIYMTKSPGDATEFVANTVAADTECHRFYACGGDGTLGEVVCGAPLSDRAEFALIPIGTGNDFCRNFDDRSAFFDIDRQITGEAMPIDLIRYNDRYCVNMMNVGFDCNVVERTVSLKKSKFIPSSMAYSVGVVSSLMHKMTTNMRITLEDGEVIERPLLLMSIANGRFYGGGYRSNPRAILDDALFDVNIIEKVSRLTFISLISSYKAGTHLETAAKYITYRQSKTLTMSFDKETLICVDGETSLATELSISIVPKATRFVLPAGVRCLSSLDAVAAKSDALAEEEANPTEEKDHELV